MLRLRTVCFIVTLAFSWPAHETRAEPSVAVKLNAQAFEFARELINQGRFVADKKGAWHGDHAIRSQENEFIREHGFAEYGKWFLGVDDRNGTGTKARYKFPFGDFQQVHRCGLLAVKARAHEHGYRDIEAAAAQLLRMIESAGPGGEKRID